MNTESKNHVWGYFAMVYGVSALLITPILLSGQGMSSALNMALMAMVTFVPSLSGITFVFLTRDKQQRRDFWKRVIRWPKGKTHYALAGMLILPVNVFLSFWISSMISGSPNAFAYATRVFTDWKTLLTFLFVEITFGALSEELGWRGFALDELLSRWNGLVASLVLGMFWAFWHTPAFLIPGTSQYAMGGILSPTYPFFIISVILGSIIHTWAYKNTGRSILVAGFLMHFTMNAALIFLGGIFDEFSLPAAYWPTLTAITALVSGSLVLIYGPQLKRNADQKIEKPTLPKNHPLKGHQ